MSRDLFGDYDGAETLAALTGLNPGSIGDRQRFVETVVQHYRRAGRPMPWRSDPNPYWVFVSEIMLQQTQVPRVMQKFPPMVERFPDFAALSAAPFSEVLDLWSGLGYNRRARWMQQAATVIVTEHAGVLPDDPAVLVRLKGVGPNTAGSIAAFAYNRPVVFIETNIRRVLLHAFFSDRSGVHDKDLLSLLADLLPQENARIWYWGLMDVGVVLARTVGNANQRSRHYSRQAPFEGSTRQLRGRILRLLGEHGALTTAELSEGSGFDHVRTGAVVQALVDDGLLQASRQRPDRWIIAD